jgi:hypothetical protein
MTSFSSSRSISHGRRNYEIAKLRVQVFVRISYPSGEPPNAETGRDARDHGRRGVITE